MKRLLKITTAMLLCLILALSAVSCGKAQAKNASGDLGTGVTWEYDSKSNVLSIKGSGKMTEFADSASVSWAAVRTSAKIITIAEGVENIGNYAFYGFSVLESVTIPDSVATIGASSFAFCTKLANVSLPDTLTKIGDRAFEGCSALSAIMVPATVTELGTHAFAYCYSIEDARILAPISIPEGAFINCGAMEDLTLNTSITAEMVGENAFKGCNISFADAVFTDSPTASASVTVRYVDTEGNELLPPEVKTDIEYGKSYSIVTPPVEGYTPDKLTVSGYIKGQNIEETVTFTKDAVEEVTEAPEEEKEEIGPSTYIAIAVLVVVLAGIGVGAFFIFRAEKKNANTNTRTVRKTDNQKKRK